MKSSDINIRDPFVLFENDTYYLYGTRAENFGQFVGGFDVYTSNDLVDFDGPFECFSSPKYNLNKKVNWAPEVHKYEGKYFMFATFTIGAGKRGTYVLIADNPLGKFVPHSKGALTPKKWSCLDGTLYVEDGTPYLVFCHEHTQIYDGTICYVELSKDLTTSIGDVVTLFKGSSLEWADKKRYPMQHFITDGPFLYRTKTDELLMIWSTFIKGNYAQCVAKSKGKSIKDGFEHLPPLIVDDGGHGMIFKNNSELYLTYHSPNKREFEHPQFIKINDTGESIEIKKE